MKFKMPFFILIIFSKILLTSLKILSPLSECHKGRISKYSEWEKGGQCSFEAHTNATGPTYLYPISPNLELFVSSSHCGICYEIVGPNGVIRGRIENYCKENDESGLCSGDMYHFNVADKGSNYLMGEGDLANVTFRMVECGFSGNIRIKTDDSTDKYFLSFVVLDHNIAVFTVRLQENQSRNWINLNRTQNNFWTFETEYGEIYLPIKLRIYSINGDYVTVEINELSSNRVYQADNNFKVPTDGFFNLTNLGKKEIPSDSRNCCEIDTSDFVPIYKNGKVNEYYYSYTQKSAVNYNSNDTYQDGSSINVKFESMGKLFFEASYPIRADQFGGISLTIKTKTICSNCIYIRPYNLQNKNQAINLDSENRWKVYRFEFDSLGVENNQFNGIVLFYNKQSNDPFEISIGNIDFLQKRNKPDAGVCISIPVEENQNQGGGGGVIPVGPIINDDDETTDISTTKEGNTTPNQTELETTIVTDINTEIGTTTMENNGTMPLTNVKILNISPYDASSLFITIDCEPFYKINDENLNLLFVSNQNSISFQTEVCNLPNSEPITSFSCKLPNSIPNGEYIVTSPSDNKYAINYSKNAYVNNGIISFDNNNFKTTEVETQVSTEMTTNFVDTTEMTEEITQKIYDSIVIINSVDQIVTKGGKVTFQINPIEKDNYYLNNKQIIFEDRDRTKALYLKECEEQVYNGNVTIIKCSFSDNIMKGTYSVLAEGQNIFISSGNSINLVSQSSTGGILTENIDRYINTNLTRTQLNNFNLTFNILYYNSSVKPGKYFPHKVSLYGKKNILRNLEETTYNHIINFTSCTAGQYSVIDKEAIGSISCKVPDYIPAGTYSKLESTGFDVMPNSKINLVFNNDFNRDSNSNGTYDRVQGITTSSSSSSKTWIIWLVLGILVFILLIVILIACCLNKKSADVSANSNESKDNIENTSQDKKSENS